MRMREGELRIGVFVCHCGVNIGGIVDVEAVVEYAKALPGVVHAERNLYTCSSEGLSRIRAAIKEHNLNRVVVAACTPRTHAPLFQKVCEEAGLNKYLFEFVNIREQCSWVHTHEKERATRKAMDLVRMAVAKVALLEPQEELSFEVTPSALVIGGGVAGMTAALNLASQGFDVYLVEREKELGGRLRTLASLYQTEETPEKIIQKLVKEVEGNKKIQVFQGATIKSVSGYIGNYDVLVSTEGGDIALKAGVIIVATGASVYEPPTGLYGYRKYENVITLAELEQRLKEGQLPEVRDVVFIHCVGARGQDKSYCSRICCAASIKNALRLRKRGVNVTILHRGVTMPGLEKERLYNESRGRGVIFVRYELERLPSVQRSENGRLEVTFYHEDLSVELKLETDMVVLVTPMVPNDDAKELSTMLKVSLGADGFFLEAHVKLRPVDFATDGIFLCGAAHFPKDVAESVAQALSAAARASIPLSRGYVVAEAISSVVDEKRCIGCGRCVEICPYGAIALRDVTLQLGEVVLVTKKSHINPVLCKGCGTCVAVCPVGAIDQRNFTFEQIIAALREATTTVT